MYILNTKIFSTEQRVAMLGNQNGMQSTVKDRMNRICEFTVYA